VAQIFWRQGFSACCKAKTHKLSGSGIEAEMMKKKTDIKNPRTPRGIRMSFPSHALHDFIQIGSFVLMMMIAFIITLREISEDCFYYCS